MIITNFEEMEKTKVNVYIDDEYAFLLYQKDIKNYKLEVGAPITLKLYEEIIENTVYRRAKQKAVAILKFMDRTELELRKKLKEAGYTELIIDRVIAYLNEYSFIDDEKYAASYVRMKMLTKSKLMIKMELNRKGIKKDIIDSILNEYSITDGEDTELIAIKKAINRKTKFPENLNPEEKQKLIASLYRKGFEINKIKQIIY